MKAKLTIFKNNKYGQPIKKSDGSVVQHNGEPMLHCALNAKINLPEGLPAGDYEVAVYQYTSKAGLKYYSGTIKPAWKAKDKLTNNRPEVKVNADSEEEEENFADSVPS